MASKKLPKKINVSIIGDKNVVKDFANVQKRDGELARLAKEALNDVKTDDKFQKKVKRYNYKKGSPKNKKFMNHDVPPGQEKKAFWLWISVGITLFIIFFLWVGTLFYLDFFNIERPQDQQTDMNVITDDIKKSYNDFTESLGNIGDQLDSIKEGAIPVEEPTQGEEIIDEKEPITVDPETVITAPGLEVQDN